MGAFWLSYLSSNDPPTHPRYVLTRIYETYDPAFLFFCNEHTFVIAENLQCYTGSLDPSDPVYLGNRFRREGEREKQVCACV